MIQDNEPAVRAYHKAGFEITRELRCFQVPAAPLRECEGDGPLPLRPTDRTAVARFAAEVDWVPSWENSFAAISRVEDRLLVLGAFDGEACVGEAVYSPYFNWVMSLVVARPHRRRGIGAALLRELAQTLLDLPWGFYSEDNLDLNNARKVLDDDHFGLDEVKERILEHLAVLKLKGDLKSPILCLHGPPGVGKTSLGKSVAKVLDRKYVRMSLGGLHDEAEIRGHRRTYIGSISGKIVQSMKRAGTINPVILLDEIDKMSMDFRGDPSSAMLEVLDPEQNHTFNDHYLEVDYNLQQGMFITTANIRYSIPLHFRIEWK